MGNEQSAGGGGATQDKTINKGSHPPPLPLLAEAEKAQMKRHFPHAKRLYLSALESIVHFMGDDSIEAARCRVKVGEMCIQEKKFDDAIVHLRLALGSMETMRKDINPKSTPTQSETKKLMGDIAFCEYNLAQKEARGSTNFNKLSIAALQKFQAISELSNDEDGGGQGTYVTELLAQDFSEKKAEGVFIPETGGQTLESAMAGVNIHSDMGKAASGMQVAKDAEECVNAVRDSAQAAEQDDDDEAGDESRRLLSRAEGVGTQSDMALRVDGQRHHMATPEARAVAKKGGNRADCNLIVASLHANTNNPVAARKVLQSTATMQRKRKVPVNATQRLAVGLDEQMRQLNALRLIQRGLMRIIRRIRIRKIFLLQRELFEEWEAAMRDAIYEFEDDICYNWTGLQEDERDTRMEEEALRWEMIREEVDDLMAAEEMDHDDLAFDEQAAFDAIMADYQEFLADLEFAQKYNPEHWQNCIDQLLDDEPQDRAKIKKREQEEWDALMAMMRISAMGAKRKEDERHAAYARVAREINEGLDAGADHIRKQEQEEWDAMIKMHYEALINDLIEQERKARPKAIDLAYQREFWRTLADDEEDERAEIKLLEEKRARALKLASEKLEREMMEALAKLQAEEQDAWNKLMRMQKKDLPLAQKKEAESKKREEVKANMDERKKAKEASRQQRELAIAEKLAQKLGNANGVVDEARVAQEIKLMKRRRSTKLPLTAQDMEMLQRHFKFADRDESGDIDREEFIYFCATVPTTKLTRQQAEELFDTLDKDGDGVLSFEEFCEIYDHMDGVLTKPPMTRRRSSLGGTLTSASAVPELPPPEPVDEAPLTPTEPAPLKTRRRSVRQPTQHTTEEPSHFLLEDEDQQQREIVDEIDATPSIVPLAVKEVSPEATPLDGPVPVSSGRRRSVVKRSGASTTAAVDIGLPEEPEVTPLQEEIGALETVAAGRRRSGVGSVSPPMPTPSETSSVGTPQEPPPLAARGRGSRRSNPQLQKARSNRVEDANAQLLEEASMREDIVEEASPIAAASSRRRRSSGVSPPQPSVEMATPSEAGASISSKAVEDGVVKKRSVRNIRNRTGASAQVDTDVFLPEDEGQTIEELDEGASSLVMAPMRRRTSSISPSISPQDAALGVGAAVAVGAGIAGASAMRSASSRRQAKARGDGAASQKVTDAALPEEDAVEVIEETDDHSLPQNPGMRRGVSNVSPRDESGAATDAKSVGSQRRAPGKKRSQAAGAQGDISAALPDDEPGGVEDDTAGDGLVPSSTTSKRRAASRRQLNPRNQSSSSQQAEASAVLIEEHASAVVDDEVQGGLGERRRSGGAGTQQSSDATTVGDEGSVGIDEEDGLVAMPKRARRGPNRTASNIGETAAASAHMLEASVRGEIKEKDDGVGAPPKRQRSRKIGAQSEASASEVETTGGLVEDSEEGLKSMPRRQQKRGSTVQIVAEQPVDVHADRVVDDLEASRIAPQRKHSVGSDLAEAVERTNFGEIVSSGEFRRGDSSVSTEASPTASERRSKRSTRQRSGGAGATSDLSAITVEDESVSGIVEDDGPLGRRERSTASLAAVSPPRTISPQEAANPRRVKEDQSRRSSLSPPSAAIASPASAAILSQQRRESDATMQRNAHARMLSEAQLKDEAAALIKRLMVRVQRTKMFMVTPDDVETIRTLFMNCDKNGNGVISRDEFVEFADRVMDMSNMTKRDVESMFDQMTANSTGTLSFAQFTDLYRHLAMEEVAKRDPALADAVKRGVSMKRRKSVNKTTQDVFAMQAGRAIGEQIDDDLAASLCMDPELVRTAVDWNQISSYVSGHPSEIGDKRLDELKTAIHGKVSTTRRAIHRGAHTASSAAIVAQDEAGAVVETDGGGIGKKGSRTRNNISPVSPRLRNGTSGVTSNLSAAVIDEEEATAVEEELHGLRQQRQSNRNHRLLWDREDRPPWSHPALDEIDQSVRDVLATSTREDAVRILEQISNEKEKRNEELFRKFPFLESLPNGVPLSELQLESNKAIAALMAQRKASSKKNVKNSEVENKIAAEVRKAAQERSNALDAFVAREDGFASHIRALVATDKMQRRMSRRRSSGFGKEAQSDSDSSTDSEAIMQRMHEDREADLNRRRQEIAQLKEDEARRKAEQEEALRRQRENDAHDLKSKNKNLRQVATNKAEAEGLIKRCIIRAGKSGALGEAELDVNDLTTIKGHFDFCDDDDSGGINRQRFFDFYMSTFDGINPMAKKDIDEVFKMFASDGSELNFMEFVEVYKHVGNLEIQKKEEKLGRKKSNVLGSRAASMAPRKPAVQKSQSNVRPRH